MAIKNAPPRPTPTPIPTFACGGKPPVLLLEYDDAAVEVAADEDNDDIGVGDAVEEEEVAVAVVPSSSVMLK